MTSQPGTVPAVLDRIAGRLPDQDALVSGDVRLTFAELRTQARRTAMGLIAFGVQPGDRVAIWLPNTWHWVVAALAVHHAGAVLVPLNTRYTAVEATDIAPPLAFMGSDASAFINGVNLLVDSGFTAAMTTGQADFSGLA